MGTVSTVVISVCERRPREGLDSHVPMILRDGDLYDAELDRFFLDLPLSGVRSPHSLRAFGYDIVVWVRFLAAARGKSVWDADRDDVDAYHRVRRRDDARFRISASSWNRAIASLDRLYRWGAREGLVSEQPFTHRTVWRRGHGGRRSQLAARNDAYERAAQRSDVRFISLEDFHVFRNVGLRGVASDGAPRPGARDRNGTRNALFADILVSTGLRLEEASYLLAHELQALQRGCSAGRQVWLELPSALTKGDRRRRVLVPTRLVQQVTAYIAVERSVAAAKFLSRSGWLAINRPIFISRPGAGSTLTLQGGGRLSIDRLTPDERGRLIICDETGAPCEPAVLWLTEVGQPVLPNSWEAAFARASRRCADAGFPLRVSPHQLRHTFAVHMLAMLIQQQLRATTTPDGTMEGYQKLLGDPLQQVQRLLGHASLATTYIYLDHVASQTDTVDGAIEALLARISAPPP